MSTGVPHRHVSDVPVRLGWSLLVVLVSSLLGVAIALRPDPVITVAACLVLGSVLLLRPDAVTPLVLGLIYSNATVVGAQYHGLPYLVPTLLPAALIVPVAYRLLVQRRRVIIASATPLVLLYLVVHILSSVASGELDQSLNELSLFTTQGLLLFLAVTNAVHSLHSVRTAIWILLAIGAFLAGLAVLQAATGTYDNDYFGFAQVGGRGLRLQTAETLPGIEALQPRASGSIGEKNFFAQTLIVLVPLALLRFWGERALILRAAALGAAIIISLGVMLTFSRGAAIGFVVLLLALLALRYVTARQLGVLIIGGLLLAGSMPAYLERLSSLEGIADATAGRGEADVDPVVQQRANDVLAAVLIFVENPLLGVGPGRFSSVYRDYAPRVGGIPGDGDFAAHSLFPEVAAQTGVIGLVVFGGIFFVTMRDLIQARRRLLSTNPEAANLATSFILAILVYLGTSVALHLSYQRYFWLLMALAGVTGYLSLLEARRLREADPRMGPEASKASQ